MDIPLGDILHSQGFITEIVFQGFWRFKKLMHFLSKLSKKKESPPDNLKKKSLRSIGFAPRQLLVMQNTALSFTERSGHWGVTSSDH